MKLVVFSVFDSKVGAYMTPFYARSRGEAIRSFSEAVNTRDHVFSKHPDDYTLFELGEFDDSNAHFDFLTAPNSLGLAQSFVSEAVKTYQPH